MTDRRCSYLQGIKRYVHQLPLNVIKLLGKQKKQSVTESVNRGGKL